MFSRRSFLTFLGGATAGILVTPVIWKGLDDLSIWTQNWGWIPRVPKGPSEYIPSISKLSNSGSITYVRSVYGQPVRIYGNYEQEYSSNNALDISNAQLHYSPARLKRPLKRGPDGGYNAITWEEAYKILEEQFNNAKETASLAAISGDKSNGFMNDILSSFTLTAGSDNFYLMPNDEQNAYAAFHNMGGQGRIAYDLENSDYIFAINANFMENWGTVMRNRRIYKDAHLIDQEAKLKVAYAAPIQDSTAAIANLWLPIANGQEEKLLLTVANVLIQKGKRSSSIGFADFANLASNYTLEKLTADGFISAEKFNQLIDDLLASEKPIVLVGANIGQASISTNMLGIALNMLLGSVNREGGILNINEPTRLLANSMSFENVMKRYLTDYVAKVASGTSPAPNLLITYNANPIYALANNSGINELYKKAKFSIAFSSFFDETCAQSSLVLPAAMDFEKFDDIYTPYGSGVVTYALAQPIIQPSYESKPAYEIFLNALTNYGYELPFDDIQGLLTTRATSLGADFDSLIEGEVYAEDLNKAFFMPIFNTSKIVANMKEAKSLPVQVCMLNKLAFGTAETAIPPFNTKTFADCELLGKYSVAQLNSQTAKKYNLNAGDIVQLDNANGKMQAKVALFEGVIPDAVLLASNLGHSAFDNFSKDKGVNITKLADFDAAYLSVNLTKVG